MRVTFQSLTLAQERCHATRSTSSRSKRVSNLLNAGRPIGLYGFELMSVPAWKKIEKYAEDNWGKGGVNIVTNPEDVSLPILRLRRISNLVDVL